MSYQYGTSRYNTKLFGLFVLLGCYTAILVEYFIFNKQFIIATADHSPGLDQLFWVQEPEKAVISYSVCTYCCCCWCDMHIDIDS